MRCREVPIKHLNKMEQLPPGFICKHIFLFLELDSEVMRDSSAYLALTRASSITSELEKLGSPTPCGRRKPQVVSELPRNNHNASQIGARVTAPVLEPHVKGESCGPQGT